MHTIITTQEDRGQRKFYPLRLEHQIEPWK
jgi:hypothetical protein